ncbi:MAG: cobalamin biosynthesis protein CobD [Paracoccaceae bacterium]|nr:cobalamin biosynthesis protein CobD [Paracoccaceae bacterium]
MTMATAMAVALVVDWALGWPDCLYRRVGHPVVWLGALIAWLDNTWNSAGIQPMRDRLSGLVAALIVITLTAFVAAGITTLLPGNWFGVVLSGVLAWPLVAARSLDEHVGRVADPLAKADLPRARRAVSMIVGRDTEQLDAAGVARAAIESLAENASDGIVAPLFWGAIFGLPGIAGYKAVNTLDSMIGHRTPRHEAFGWAAARIDDVANLIPARLCALLFALVSPRPGASLKSMLQDAGRHRSPNAGWPEAAMAGGLGIRLSGPRFYGDTLSDEPWLNAKGRDPDPIGISKALGLYRRTLLVLAVVLLFVGTL